MESKNTQISIGYVDRRIAVLYNVSLPEGSSLVAEGQVGDHYIWAFRLPDPGGDWILLYRTEENDRRYYRIEKKNFELLLLDDYLFSRLLRDKIGNLTIEEAALLSQYIRNAEIAGKVPNLFGGGK